MYKNPILNNQYTNDKKNLTKCLVKKPKSNRVIKYDVDELEMLTQEFWNKIIIEAGLKCLNSK